MAIPTAYDSDDARDRIEAGLQSAGYSSGVAKACARDAIAEAPFAPIDEAGWKFVCDRGRQLAANIISARNQPTGAVP